MTTEAAPLQRLSFLLRGNGRVVRGCGPAIAVEVCTVPAVSGCSTTYRLCDKSPILGVKLKGERHGVC